MKSKSGKIIKSTDTELYKAINVYRLEKKFLGNNSVQHSARNFRPWNPFKPESDVFRNSNPQIGLTINGRPSVAEVSLQKEKKTRQSGPNPRNAGCLAVIPRKYYKTTKASKAEHHRTK